MLTADNGLDAVDMATAELPNVVILDLDLPGLSGCDVARRLRSATSTSAIPLIAATGHSNDQRTAEARDVGFTSVLLKPCEPEGFVRAIENVISRPHTLT